MRRLYFLIPLFFFGCTASNTVSKVNNFSKCYVHKMPAPFWVCYQSSFISVGKVHCDKTDRLKINEAYSYGISRLIQKLTAKTKIFLTKLGINDKKIDSDIKDFVIMSADQGDTWYSKKEKMIYVQVKIDKDEFKNFLSEKYKNIDKKVFERAFNETF